jgi:Gluconate 2-dehydrogenase subunit 3
MGTTPGDRGRFDGFDVLAQAGHWDRATREVVDARLRPGATLFFDPDETKTARALLDRLLAQDDEPKIPLLELIEPRLAVRETDGYRYVDMPDDGDAWKRSLGGLDADAGATHGRRFAALAAEAQKGLIEAVRTAKGEWHGMPAARVFQLWMRYATTAFYSHPWAWNEIGFAGPAYPRGFKTLAIDRREPFERPERDAHDPVRWAHKVDAAQSEHGVTSEPTEGH